MHITASTKMNGLRILDAFDFPWETLSQPGIGFLNLVAVYDTLVEHAVLVSNAVANDR